MKHIGLDCRHLTASVILYLLAISASGCGGGGGGGGAGVTAQVALVTAAQSAEVYLGGTLGLGAVSPTATIRGKNQYLPLHSQIVERAVAAMMRKAASSSQWTNIQGSVYYYQYASVTSTTVDMLLSTDGTTNNAGYIDYTLVSAPGSLPQVIEAKIDLTVLGMAITGTTTTTVYDSFGANSDERGTLSSAVEGVSTSYDVTYKEGSLSSVSITGAYGSAKVMFTGISWTSTDFYATFNAGGISGPLDLKWNASGNAKAIETSGTSSLTWNTDQYGTFTSSTGKVIQGSLESLQESGNASPY